MLAIIEVAVAVIEYQQQYLLAFRHQRQHQGDRYEFVGGKVEAEEQPQTALIREVDEEIGLTLGMQQLRKLGRIEHDYGDKQVRLYIYQVSLSLDQYQQLAQRQYGLEGQALTWVSHEELLNASHPLPAANLPILSWLCLPSHLVVSQEIAAFATHQQPLAQWLSYHQQQLPEQAVVYLRPKAEQLSQHPDEVYNRVINEAVEAWVQTHQSGQKLSEVVTASESATEEKAAIRQRFVQQLRLEADSQHLDATRAATQYWLIATVAISQLLRLRPDIRAVLPAGLLRFMLALQAADSETMPIRVALDETIAKPAPSRTSIESMLSISMAETLLPFYQRGQIMAHQLTQSELMSWEPVSDGTILNCPSTDNSAPLKSLVQYYQQLPLLASCHDKLSLLQANKTAQQRTALKQGALMAVFISPVLTTQTHPQAATLGWQEFAKLAELADMPVIALGGLSPADYPKALAHGAIAVAGIRQFM